MLCVVVVVVVVVVVETAVIFSKSLPAHHSRDILRDTQTWHVEGRAYVLQSLDLPVAQSHPNPSKSQAKHLTLAYHVANGVQEKKHAQAGQKNVTLAN